MARATSRRALVLALLGLFVTARPADAQVDVNAPYDDEIIITDLRPSGQTCRESVEPASVEEITREPKRYKGRCVRISGLVDGAFIYFSQQRHVPSPGGFGSDEHLGFYPHDAFSTLLSRPLSAEIVGVVDSCDRFHVAQVMIFGYCHYDSGPFLMVVHAEAENWPRDRSVSPSANVPAIK